MNTSKADLNNNLLLLQRLAAQKPDDISPGGPISRAGLDAYLKNRNAERAVPMQYQEWILRVNGLQLCWNELFGIGPGVNNAIDVYESIKLFKERYFPIGDNGGCNYFVVDILRLDASGDGPVLYAPGDNGWKPLYILASSIHQFIRFILVKNALDEDEAENSPWPFDKEYMFREDPAIAQFGYPLPWEA